MIHTNSEDNYWMCGDVDRLRWQRAISKAVSEGWKLYGNPIIREGADGYTWYYQALIKEDE